MDGADDVGAKGHAGADLAERRCGLVDMEGDVPGGQADAEGDAAYASADDGDLEGLLGCGWAHFEVRCRRIVREGATLLELGGHELYDVKT